MKIHLTYEIDYDTTEVLFNQEYEESMSDYEHTLESLIAFSIDRFINLGEPSFIDSNGWGRYVVTNGEMVIKRGDF